MRKYICVVFVSIMIICLVAEAAYADEILFRGLPWYSSMAEVKASFADDPILVDEVDEAVQVLYSKIDGNMHNLSYGITGYPAGWVAYSYLDGMDFNVAGYGLSDMMVYCCYGLDENNVDREINSSRLYLASYTFNVVDKQGAFEDLKEKLTSLYGNGIENAVENSYYAIGENDLEEVSFTEHKIEWLGDNNTAAVLVYSESALGNSDLFHHYLVLTYGKTDSDAMVQAVCDAVEAERMKTEKQNRTNNTNGL
ncbi:MAG: hypothetical protein IJ231_09190 [Clostridia bacterium]|nr:hypothetical protein [Clostridia bacterium]